MYVDPAVTRQKAKDKMARRAEKEKKLRQEEAKRQKFDSIRSLS